MMSGGDERRRIVRDDASRSRLWRIALGVENGVTDGQGRSGPNLLAMGADKLER